MNFVFGLPEGHWPSAKTADEVISMLFYVMNLSTSRMLEASFTHLRLHADNCSGQNKNRFVLFFILYLAMSGRFKSVQLCFMIPGHTKNVCDGSFGHVKRKYRSENVLHPGEMMKVISNSAKNTECVPSVAIDWMKWRDLLVMYFKVPSSFKITRYQIFESREDSPGELFAKALHDSETEEKFSFLSLNCCEAQLVAEHIDRDLKQNSFKKGWKGLSEIPVSNKLSRRMYLEKSVLHPLFPGQEEFKKLFLSNGTSEE